MPHSNAVMNHVGPCTDKQQSVATWSVFPKVAPDQLVPSFTGQACYFLQLKEFDRSNINNATTCILVKWPSLQWMLYTLYSAVGMTDVHNKLTLHFTMRAMRLALKTQQRDKLIPSIISAPFIHNAKGHSRINTVLIWAEYSSACLVSWPLPRPQAHPMRSVTTALCDGKIRRTLYQTLVT